MLNLTYINLTCHDVLFFLYVIEFGLLIVCIAFLSYQCREIEENDKMRKTRDLVKKIRVFKGTFHTKMELPKGQK